MVAIAFGDGLTVVLSDPGDGRWRLAFGGDAPPLAAIRVEAVKRNGQVAPLRMFPGDRPDTVFASGPIETAYRARITLEPGGATRCRDVLLPQAPGYEVTTGPKGGTLISMGHDSYVEVVPAADGRWTFTFMDKTEKANAPSVADVVAEAIAEAATDGQVRRLAVVPGGDPWSLVAGPVAGATYLRLAVMMGDHYHTRCVPVVQP